MKNKIYIVLLLSLSCLLSKAQEFKVVGSDVLEKQVQEYINRNIESLELSPSMLQSIKEGCEKEKIEHGEECDVKAVVYDYKKQALRQKYYNDNFSKEEYWSKANRQISGCQNGGFENGTPFNNTPFDFQYFTRNNWNHQGPSTVATGFLPVTPSPILNDFNSSVSIVTPGPVTMQNWGFPNVQIPIANRVLNGNFAIRLNNASDDFAENATLLRKNFVVDEPVLTINFAALFEDPGHPNNPNGTGAFDPFLRIQVYDQFNNFIDGQAISSGSASAIINDIDNAGNWRCIDWTCPDLNVNNFIGQSVTLEIVMADCSDLVHDAVVFIDDICNNSVPCGANTFGDITLDPFNINCPVGTFEVCGNYTLPSSVSLPPDITLTLESPMGNQTFNNPSIDQNAGTFCFNINPANLNTSTSYEIAVNGVFTNAQGTINVNNQNTNPLGADISFQNCCEPLSNIRIIESHTLEWDGTAPVHLEFRTDDACCEVKENRSQSYTVNNGSMNLLSVVNDLGSLCFQVRLSNDCTKWTKWCCIESCSNGFFFSDDCFDFPCSGYDDLIVLENPNDNVLSGQSVNYNIYKNIEATNKIYANASSIYKATESISLKPGFKAYADSDFRAYVEECRDSFKKSKETCDNLKMNEAVNNPRLYPNPTSSILYAEDLEGVTSWSLNDLNGNVVRSGKLKVGESKLEIRTQNLSQGIYYFNAILKDGKPYQESIIVKH